MADSVESLRKGVISFEAMHALSKPEIRRTPLELLVQQAKHAREMTRAPLLVIFILSIRYARRLYSALTGMYCQRKVNIPVTVVSICINCAVPAPSSVSAQRCPFSSPMGFLLQGLLICSRQSVSQSVRRLVCQ